MDISGFYIYIESSTTQRTTRRSGDVARLASQSTIDPGTTGMCVEFWYHMFGEDIDRLNVKVVSALSAGKYLQISLYSIYIWYDLQLI